MTQVRTIRITLAVAALAVAVGCNDPMEPAEEQELITRVTMTLTPTGGGAAQTSVIEDEDGLGPLAPAAPSITFQLTPGETYNGTIRFEDASDPANVENITEEVEEEALLHRVFYILTGTGVDVPDNSLDTDTNGAPLGLMYQVVVDAAATGNGTIQVILSHYDEEPKGDGSEQSDETDVDVTFAFTVS